MRWKRREWRVAKNNKSRDVARNSRKCYDIYNGKQKLVWFKVFLMRSRCQLNSEHDTRGAAWCECRWEDAKMCGPAATILNNSIDADAKHAVAAGQVPECESSPRIPINQSKVRINGWRTARQLHGRSVMFFPSLTNDLKRTWNMRCRAGNRLSWN